MAVKYQTIGEEAENQRLDNYLLKHLKGVPKSHIYRIVRKGEVRVNKGRKKADYKLKIGDVVRIPPVRVAEKTQTNVSDSLNKVLKDSILYEDKGVLVINKPSGLAVHGGSGVNIGAIEALRQIYNRPLELVHRIDRATSGVLLIAKKRSVLKNLHEQLTQHQMHKRYTALVKNSWSKKAHTIDAPLYQNSRMVVVDSKGKESISHFHPLKNFESDNFSASLVDVVIETGRMHQIRAHAKHAGHELAGDEKYGDKIFNQKIKAKGLARLFLHASELQFTNPTTGELQKVSAPLSIELQEFIDKL